MKISNVTLAALTVGFVGACGGARSTAFFPAWEDDGGDSIQPVVAALKGKTPHRAKAAVVGVDAQGAVVGMTLEGGTPWRYSHALTDRPTVAGDVVVGNGGDEVFALDSATGNLLWKVGSNGHLRGAGDDGVHTAVTLSSPSAKGATLLVVNRQGQVVLRVEDPAQMGIPAVWENYVFVPWQGQYISAFDLGTKQEAGRILARAQISRAFVASDALYFGGAAAIRFDDKVGLASRHGATTLKLPRRELPGSPSWFLDGTEPMPVQSGGPDRIRIYAQPGSVEKGGAFAATYFRIAMGFGATKGELRWVQTSNAEWIGGSTFQGGMALCDTAGDVTFISEDSGGKLGKVSLGTPLSSCVVQADGFMPKGDPPSAEGLTVQLSNAVKLPYSEHVMAQRLLLRELAQLEGPLATQSLIELASEPKTAPIILEESRSGLAARRTGADHMIEALKLHYDFLADRLRPPPVGPLADALRALEETRAAPLLAAHLNDSADTDDDIERAARALEFLATADQKPDLLRFFAHYRCASENEPLARATLSVATALLRLKEDKALREATAAGACTTESVKEGLSLLLTPAPAAAPAAAKPAK